MDATLEGEVDDLEVHGIIGFDGAILGGLRVHPDGEHIIYPLGNKVSVQHWETKKQDFLSGHTNVISAIDVSPSGKYIASGQINHIGFKAWAILWDFKTRSILSKHELHKVRIEAVKFSRDDRYLFSLGGRDCGNVVVWDILAGAPFSGTPASRGSKGNASTLCACNRRGVCFITGGDGNLIVWSMDVVAKSISGIDVNVYKLKRVIYCMDINERDEVCYCGTSTGDILKIRLNFHHDAEILIPIKPPTLQGCYTRISQKKLPRGTVDLYGQGVRSILLLRNGQLLIGAGDGTVDLVEEIHIKGSVRKEAEPAGFKLPSHPTLRVLRSTHVKGSVSSLQMIKSDTVLAGTEKCEIFAINFNNFEAELLVTCHSSSIYDVAFPHEFSEVFATAGKDDVRIWNVGTFQELLRIKVPNFTCSCVKFAHDGKSIITSWNDGVIRAFTPLTGRLIYAILNAHNKGVSAIGITHNGRTLVSGGCEGQVRLWDISPYKQQLCCTLKDHSGPVSEIHINAADDEAVSASTDGSCIIWDIIRQCRKQSLFGNTLFMCIRYYPTGVQILTGGTDRKLGYWEVLDGSLVREIEGSPSGAINSLDINSDGTLFATGGNDQIVKLWKYQEGVTKSIGVGHSAVITAVRFSPDNRYIVSASAAGSVFLWKNPFYKKVSDEKPSVTEPEKVEKKSEPVVVSPKPPKTPKEEVIQDLPSSRSSASHGSGDNEVCPCPCKRPIPKRVCECPGTPPNVS